MWQPAYPMGSYASKKIGCKTAAVAYTDFPPGKDSVLAFKTGFKKAGGKVVLSIPMGPPRRCRTSRRSAARQGHASRLPLVFGRPARTRSA